MATREIKTEAGTIVRLSVEEHGTFVTLTGGLPDRARVDSAGLVVDGMLHPDPFPAFTVGPAVLRAIADLIETTDSEGNR